VGLEERGLPDFEQIDADDEYHAVGSGDKRGLWSTVLDAAFFDWDDD